jgi:hypothetical protein
VITLRGNDLSIKQGDAAAVSSMLPKGLAARRALGIAAGAAGTQFANFYVRELK